MVCVGKLKGSVAIVGLVLALGCDTGEETNGPANGAAFEADPSASEPGSIEGPVFEGGAWVPGACSADLFMDVAAYAGPGGDYPMPELAVSCSDTTMTVTSNGIPHYTYQSMTPNALEAQNFVWEVPLSPTELAGVATIPCLGTVGFTVNGIPIYGPNEGPFPDPYGDPIANDVMDWCLGHTGGSADYHYHGVFEECFNIPESTGPSPVIGFAMDGYPIYGPRGCVDADCTDVVTFKSGWDAINVEKDTCASNADCGSAYTCANAMVDGVAKKACVVKDYAWENHAYTEKEGADFLDECNGRVGPDGTYRYHTTDTFPYALGCYRGEASSDAGAMGGGNCPTQ